MRKLGKVIVALVMLQAGCGDDNNNLDSGTIIDGIVGTTFHVTLTPQMEVPVCAAAGANATGAATVVISTDQSTVAVEGFTFSGLSGAATAAHIHAGAIGVAGPIVFDLSNTLTPPINRTFTAADYPSPAPAGAPATFAEFVRQMLAGGSYLNVHTAACPNGEIRGQIQ